MSLLFLSETIAIVLLSFAILRPNVASAAEPPLSVEEVARIFGYPAEKLKVEDVTEQANRRAERKGKPQGISVHTFSSADNTFARFSIAVAAGGALLTEDIKQNVSEATRAQLANNNLPTKWLNLNDAGYGIVGLGMAGPGGSEERAVMTLFNNTDVQVTITLPGESPLQVLPGAEAYHDSIYQGGIHSKLIDCLNTVASKVAGKPVQATASDTPPPKAVSPDPMPRVKQLQRPTIQLGPNQNVAPSPIPSSSSEKDSASKSVTVGAAVALFSVLALLIWRVARRRTS